jgi:hypothetical protein
LKCKTVTVLCIFVTNFPSCSYYLIPHQEMWNPHSVTWIFRDLHHSMNSKHCVSALDCFNVSCQVSFHLSAAAICRFEYLDLHINVFLFHLNSAKLKSVSINVWRRKPTLQNDRDERWRRRFVRLLRRKKDAEQLTFTGGRCKIGSTDKTN